MVRWGILKAKTPPKKPKKIALSLTVYLNSNNKISSRLSGLKGSVSNRLNAGQSESRKAFFYVIAKSS